MRRIAVEQLRVERERNRPRLKIPFQKNETPYPETRLTYTGNVLNQKAAAFYRRHGVTDIQTAAESGPVKPGLRIMTTKYCLKRLLGFCPQQGVAGQYKEPFFLVDDMGRKYRLNFNCRECVMEVYY